MLSHTVFWTDYRLKYVLKSLYNKFIITIRQKCLSTHKSKGRVLFLINFRHVPKVPLEGKWITRKWHVGLFFHADLCGCQKVYISRRCPSKQYDVGSWPLHRQWANDNDTATTNIWILVALSWIYPARWHYAWRIMHGDCSQILRVSHLL